MWAWKVFAASVLLCSAVVQAQRFPDRLILLNPLLDTTRPLAAGELGWMHSLAGWGEFGGYLRGDEEHAWIQRLGAIIELVRFGMHSSLSFASEIEFIANPHNDIRFNPRAVFWQEGFLFTHYTGSHYWQLGYYHRCKHDVDNLTIGRERSLIYGSLLGKYIVPVRLADAGIEGAAAIRGDLYTIRLDARTPPSDNQTPFVDRMIGSLGGSIHLRRPLAAPWIGTYAVGWMFANFYGDRSSTYPVADRVRMVTIHGGIAAGISITGAAHFRLGVTYEYLADTGINPVPERSHLLSVTIAVVNPQAMW